MMAMKRNRGRDIVRRMNPVMNVGKVMAFMAPVEILYLQI